MATSSSLPARQRLLQITRSMTMQEAAYLSWMLATTPSRVRTWLGEACVQRSVSDDFQSTLRSRMESEENAAEYARRCPVPGANPSDYRLREIVLSGDLQVLAGIHFRNLDTRYPFAGVYAQTRSLSPGELVDASARLRELLTPFCPRNVQWWISGEASDPRGLPHVVGDRRLVAGSLREIAASERPSAAAAIHLRSHLTGTAYADYVRWHDEFMRAHPEWEGRIAKTTRETFDDCAENGVLCSVEIRARRAGVLLARPGTIRGMSGWLMVDELLSSRYRGRGFAARMQRLFLERLDPETHPIVLGTIDDQNLPSLRTAQRVGRSDVGGWVFVNPP